MNKNVYGWLHAPIQILSTVHLKEKLVRLGRGGRRIKKLIFN
jgi:hypothetical protein